MKPTKTEYGKVLKENPSLCAQGMADRSQENFQANRKSLEVSYDSFLICHNWLSKLSPEGRTALTSRHSIEIKHQIETQCGQFIPHGSVLAAAIFLGIELRLDSCSPQFAKAPNAD